MIHGGTCQCVCTCVTLVWPARPFLVNADPFPSSPLGACWDGLAGQTSVTRVLALASARVCVCYRCNYA